MKNVFVLSKYVEPSSRKKEARGAEGYVKLARNSYWIVQLDLIALRVLRKTNI